MLNIYLIKLISIKLEMQHLFRNKKLDNGRFVDDISINKILLTEKVGKFHKRKFHNN